MPAGSALIGAGWQTLYSDGVVVDEAILDTDAEIVRVEAYDDENGAPNAWALQARAICATGITNAEAASDNGSDFNSVSPTSDTVDCPFGKKVVGVGFEIANNSTEGEVHVTKVDPAEDSLTVTAYEDDDGTTASWSVTAYAVCATEPSGLELRSSTSPGGRTDQATCPTGKVAIGGGADLGTVAPRDLAISGLKIGTLNSSFGGNDYGFAEGREGSNGTSVNSDDWEVAAEAICPVTCGTRSLSIEALPYSADKRVATGCRLG